MDCICHGERNDDPDCPEHGTESFQADVFRAAAALRDEGTYPTEEAIRARMAAR